MLGGSLAPGAVSNHSRGPICPQEGQCPRGFVDQDREEVPLASHVGDGLSKNDGTSGMNEPDLIDDHSQWALRPPPGHRRLPERLQKPRVVRHESCSAGMPSAEARGHRRSLGRVDFQLLLARSRPASGSSLPAGPDSVRRAGPKPRRVNSRYARCQRPKMPVRPIRAAAIVAARSTVTHPVREPRCLIRNLLNHGPTGPVHAGSKTRRSRNLSTSGSGRV